MMINLPERVARVILLNAGKVTSSTPASTTAITEGFNVSKDIQLSHLSVPNCRFVNIYLDLI